MAEIKFFKVTSLPEQLENDSLYFVKSSATLSELYLTSNTGVAIGVVNMAAVTEIVNNIVGQLDGAQFVILDTFTDLESYTSVENKIILVVDASGDSTVDSGAALYVWNAGATGTKYSKIAEYESQDLQVTWDALQNKPSSTVTEIDNAVNWHKGANNLETLAKLSEVDSTLAFNGQPISSGWSDTNW